MHHQKCQMPYYAAFDTSSTKKQERGKLKRLYAYCINDNWKPGGYAGAAQSESSEIEPSAEKHMYTMKIQGRIRWNN